ncbi:MAG TPA: iron-sulfur cluster assembly protein IscA [Castellaniella sp.]|uniref:iron-sulfur cluster assembly protein IscA n=1 Tax=Castellaniella sp. TaxID=1955812 RepID=UPI002F249D0F
MGITLTQQAAEHIQQHLESRGKGVGLRLGVKPSGCSGLSYLLEYVDDPQPSDQIFEQFGARLYVAPENLQYLQGTELDYAREGLNEGFRFNNPNEKAACGCGDSFTV